MGTPRDTLSLTPATRDTGSQEVLKEHVSLMDCGQEVQLLVQVSISVFASYIMISVAISIPILQYETEPISESITAMCLQSVLQP